MSERRASDDVGTSEARAIVRRLIDAGEGLPDSVRHDIVDLSDAAVSPLLEILEDASLALGNAPGGRRGTVHAARLLGDNTHVEIRMKEDPDVLESCAWGLIYAIGILSFADARPRGNSEMMQ